MGFSGKPWRGDGCVERAFEALLKGKPLNMDRKRGACWTDGSIVYSYDLAIAWRDGDNVRVVTEAERRLSDRGMSMTTGAHVRRVEFLVRRASLEHDAYQACAILDHAAQ